MPEERSIWAACPLISLPATEAREATSSMVRASSTVVVFSPCSRCARVDCALAMIGIEILGVAFKTATRTGLVFIADHDARLLQGGALVLEAGIKRADALLIAAEGALDGGDFLVHDAFELGGALHGVLDAADQDVDFGTHRLGDRGKAVGGDVLRPDEPHRRLNQNFRNLA